VYFLAHAVFFTGARLASAVAGACNVRSSQLLTASMLGALGALGVLYAGSHLAARDGSIWLVWVGCAFFGLFQGPMWPAMESLLSEECAIVCLAGWLRDMFLDIIATVGLVLDPLRNQPYWCRTVISQETPQYIYSLCTTHRDRSIQIY
jgi:hypothetical protein